MKYLCLNHGSYSSGEYSVTAIRELDIYLIKEWRNAQIAVLRQKRPLTNDRQKAYYNNVVRPSFEMGQPNIILFSYLLGSNCIGYGGLTNIDWNARRAEISFILDTDRIVDTRQYQQDFGAFLSLMKRIAFDELGLNRLFTETYDIRPWHVAVLENNGFEFEGRLKQHVYIEGRLVDSLMHGCLREQYDAKG